ncbi:MAG: hypothetical protein ACR2NL_10825, partial [Acidimicrobiia bacterium]
LQDEESIIERAKKRFGSIRQLSERSIPLPSSLGDHPALRQLVTDKVARLTQRGSRFVWTARVWEISV